MFLGLLYYREVSFKLDYFLSRIIMVLVSLTATTSEISRDDILVQHCQSSSSESSSERSIIAPVGSPITGADLEK